MSVCSRIARRLHPRTRSRLVTAATLAVAALLGLTAAPAGAQVEETRALAYSSRSDTIQLAELEHAFLRLAEQASPAVVAITASDRPADADGPAKSSELTPSAVDQLLGSGSHVVGTGFCIDERGYILTNEHVVAGARQLYVTTDAGRVYPAFVVGTDPRSDLAVLKVPTTLPTVTFASMHTPLRRGQWAVALGNPVGLGGAGGMCFSAGVVSATGRNLPSLSQREGRLYSNLIQTTAEVNPGNSGGPLFDLAGRVVGVVTAVVLPYGTTNGVGFAIPADASLHRKIETLTRGELVQHGYLGVAVQDVPGGARVTRIGSASPADGQLQVGDVLLRIGGEQVNGEGEFVRLVSTAGVDQAVPVVVRRDGREVAVNVQLAPRDDAAGVGFLQQRLRWHGVTFANCNRPDGTTATCVINVDFDSPLANTLKAGQVIVGLNGQPAANLVALQAILDQTDPTQAIFQAAD